MFDAFWSTKAGGMGIGLAICQSIVTAHHGRLTVANNPEGGATFCAALPVRQQRDSLMAAMETVFLVDDDAAVRKALSRVLREEGWNVETFESAEAFLARARPARQAGCLVLDVTMPGLDGLELQRRLDEEGQALPIVFLTGHGDIPMSVHAIKAGAADFLTKPVDVAGAVDAPCARPSSRTRRRRQARAEIAALEQRLASADAA